MQALIVIIIKSIMKIFLIPYINNSIRILTILSVSFISVTVCRHILRCYN